MFRLPLRTSVVLLTAAAAAVASGCAPGSSEDDTAPKADTNQLTFLIGKGVTSMDPALAADGYARVIQAFMYDKLIGIDPETGESVSNIATSWEITSTEAHFEIADGITCADGTPFTAETVVRNLERIKDPKTAAPLTATFLGSYDYEVALGEDGQSVDITYAEPMPFAERRLAEGPGLVCDSGLDNPAELEKQSAGTGPYVLTKATADDSYEMDLRDSDYTWGIGGAEITDEMPKNVTFRVMADPNAMANLVNSGDADVALLGGAALMRVTGDVSSVPMTSTSFSLFFNHRDDTVTADPAVRTALSEALSAEDFTAVAGEGDAQPATSVTAAGTTCSASGEVTDAIPTGGIEAASATLTEAGWTKDDSGVWAKDGKTLTLRFVNLDVQAPGVEYIRSTLSDLGADVKVDSRSGSEAVGVAFGGKEWEITITGYGADVPPLNLLGGPFPPAGSNFSAIDNPDYAQAVEDATDGAAGDCEGWIEAERPLLSNADILPLMDDKLVYVSPNWDLGAGPSAFYLVPTELSPR